MSPDINTKTTELAKIPEMTQLPVGRALVDYYALEFAHVTLPDTFRMAREGEHADVTVRRGTEDLLHTPAHTQFLQYEFRREVLPRAVADSWWEEAERTIRRNGTNIRSISQLPVIGKHRIDMMVGDRKTGQHYDVIEMGAPADPDIVETTINTLKLVDQYTGGLLAAQDKGTRVVLVQGISLRNSLDKDREAGGFAEDGALIINTDGIRTWEGVTEENYQEVLATVIAHEVLGHGTEMAVLGPDQDFFDDHFAYPDGMYVTPKDAALVGSKPVNEYGGSNATEDLATSAEAMVAHAMGWSGKLRDVEVMKSEPDEQRSALVLDLMERAARLARQYNHTPGFVGSEVHYSRDVMGAVTGIEPVRTMQVTHMPGAEALADELRSVVERLTPKDELVVGRRRW